MALITRSRLIHGPDLRLLPSNTGGVLALPNFRTLRIGHMTAQEATPSSCLALISSLVSLSPSGVITVLTLRTFWS